MKAPQRFILTLMLLCNSLAGFSVNFDDWFTNQTLRVDYIFAGDNRTQEISVAQFYRLPVWAGRRVNLEKLLLQGNGQITMTDSASGTVIYEQSFSTLFQEWQHTAEATRVRQAFENVFLLPMPLRPVKITTKLFNNRDQVTASNEYVFNPKDILIRELPGTNSAPHKYIWQSGPVDQCINVAIVAEGYTAAEQSLFYEDAKNACKDIFSYEPFASLKDRFNVMAVALPSVDSGVSRPKEHQWRNTAVQSHYDTFYSDRYLTTLHLDRLHDALAGIPYDHIIILANSNRYGGGGIFNFYMLTAAHISKFRPVVAHEFGHSFAGLADEYYYDDQYEINYPAGVEPWEPNITTLTDFAAKWQDLVTPGTPIPTPPDSSALYTKIGAFEGGGYQSKGVYRACQDCRMKTNEAPAFCPVCRRAIRRMIDFNTREQ